MQQSDLLKTKYSIENQMQLIENQMKAYAFTVSHETIFKYYLAFLDRNDQKETSDKKDQDRSRLRLRRSTSSDSDQKQRRHNHGETYLEDECLRKFVIPELSQMHIEHQNDQ